MELAFQVGMAFFSLALWARRQEERARNLLSVNAMPSEAAQFQCRANATYVVCIIGMLYSFYLMCQMLVPMFLYIVFDIKTPVGG